jgi:aminomethyltransferase
MLRKVCSVKGVAQQSARFRTLSASKVFRSDAVASGDTATLPAGAILSPRLRKSPFFERTLQFGAQDFTSYNRMLMPLGYGDPAAEYKALTEGVACWDVAAERQVELVGPDAFALAQLLTCRDISKIKERTCVYAIMCDPDGVVINDPVLLKLSNNRFWFSIADSDAMLWAKGLAVGRGMDVQVREPDVSPLALQGPRSAELVADLFGAEVTADMKYFAFRRGPATVLDGDIPITLARSGWSPEHGYELYLEDSSKGSRLWDLVFEAGAKYGIQPGAPNQQRRVEAGMLSFGR